MGQHLNCCNYDKEREQYTQQVDATEMNNYNNSLQQQEYTEIEIIYYKQYLIPLIEEEFKKYENISVTFNSLQTLQKEITLQNVKEFNENYNKNYLQKTIQLLNNLYNPFTERNFFDIIPLDISLQILSFLEIKEIVKLRFLNRNFLEFWTLHPILWNNYFLKNSLQKNCLNLNSFVCCKKFIKNTKDFLNLIYLPNEIYLPIFFKILKCDYELIKKLKNKKNIIKYFIICIKSEDTNDVSDLIKSFCKIYKKNELILQSSILLQVKKIENIYLKLNLFQMNGFDATTIDGFLFCFDVTSEISFTKMKNNLILFLKNNLKEYNKDRNGNLNKYLKNLFSICIVGFTHKINEFNKRNVTVDDLNIFLADLQKEEIYFNELFLNYFEMNLKESINVELPFFFIAKNILFTKYMQSRQFVE